MKLWRRWLARIVLALVATLGALKVGDLAVGWLLRTPERHLLRLPVSAHERHVSTEFDCEFTTNSHGLRGPERPYAKPAGTLRVAVVGDSYVAGYEVPDDAIFTAKLEVLLNEAASPAQVINVGRGGSSTIREVDLYNMVARRFSPDVVVLAYFLGNDLVEVLEEHDAQERRQWRPRGTVRRAAYAFLPNMYLELALFRLSTESRASWSERNEEQILARLKSECEVRGASYEKARTAYRELPLDVRQDLESGRLHNHRVLRACYQPDRLQDAIYPDDALFERAWPRTAKHLELLRQNVAADGARLVVLIIPDAAQIDEEANEFTRKLGYHASEDWLTEPSRTGDAVARWCAESAVPCLDLTEDFRRAPAQIYFPQDDHLNVAGHALTAKLLAEFLRTQGALAGR